MAQLRNTEISILGAPEKKCRLCKEEKQKSIFYVFDEDNTVCICEDCFTAVEALFIDVLFEREDKYNIKTKDELKRLSDKMKRIKKMRGSCDSN